MKKLYILLLLIVGFCYNPVKAQIDTNAIGVAYLASDYIFEGRVVDQCTYSSGGNLYTINHILISKMIKGGLTCGYINLITPGGQLDGYQEHVTH